MGSKQFLAPPWANGMRQARGGAHRRASENRLVATDKGRTALSFIPGNGLDLCGDWADYWYRYRILAALFKCHSRVPQVSRRSHAAALLPGIIVCLPVIAIESDADSVEILYCLYRDY